MKVLICNLLPLDQNLFKNLDDLGIGYDLLAHEFDDIEDYSDYQVVIGNKLFKYHPIEAFTNLKHIILLTSTYGQLDLAYLKAKGITYSYAHDLYASTMAEFCLSRILEVLKAQRYMYQQQINKSLTFKSLMNLENKAVLLVGSGSVASSIKQLLVAFKVQLNHIAFETVSNTAISELEGLLHKQDIVILCLSLNQDTYHLLDEERLSLMKDNSLLVNMGRSKLIAENNFYKVVKSKQLKVILELSKHEPLALIEGLWTDQDIYLSAPNAYLSDEAYHKVSEFILQSIKQIKTPE